MVLVLSSTPIADISQLSTMLFLMKFKHILRIILLYIFGGGTVLGLRCCTRAFSSCSKQGLLFLAVRGLLIAVASLVAEHGLSSCGSWALECRLSSCGTRA